MRLHEIVCGGKLVELGYEWKKYRNEKVKNVDRIIKKISLKKESQFSKSLAHKKTEKNKVVLLVPIDFLAQRWKLRRMFYCLVNS